MSRCFPFPPPGYEKKPRPEDGDILKEENRKEKKHKKEKKDREKKEGKEKKDKERSDGKHREKKDKKEKHRDKKDKKDKEKDKDKERSSISEEARVTVLPGASSGQKLSRGDEHVNKEDSINSHETKFRDQSHGQHGEKLIKTNLPVAETEDSKFVQELARRIRDEPKAAGSQLAERFPVGKTTSMYIKGGSGNLAEDKEKNKDKRVHSSKMDGQAVCVEPRIGANNAVLPSFSEMAKSKYHGMPRPLEENVRNRREEKEESKQRHDEKPRDKKNDKKEKDKRSHGKEKDREKEKKKEEKVKDKRARRISEQDNTTLDFSKNDFVGVNFNKNDFVGVSNTNNQVPLVPKDNIASTATDGNLRKRKDIGTNGFLHESEVRTAKLLRPSSSHQSIQNGTRFEPHQKADMLPSNIQVATNIQVLKKEQSVNGTIKLSNKHGVATNSPMENKEQGINGTTKVQPLAISEPKPLTSSKPKSPGADQIAEASRRPPHPDCKYLNQILSVPKMDEWTGFDDQEWLFGNKSSLIKKPEVCLDEVQDNRVWSEALQIDSADVCALPYVIPY